MLFVTAHVPKDIPLRTSKISFIYLLAYYFFPPYQTLSALCVLLSTCLAVVRTLVVRHRSSKNRL